MKKLLVIGHTFPEPGTTAAGSRMMKLLALFSKANYTIVFASTAAVSEHTVIFGHPNISIKKILLNDASFDLFLKEVQPDVVIFDRYITEEQFGWRVSENCGNALKILDTEDLHFLRKAREEAVKKDESIAGANIFTETAKREIASILRCDLSLIISEYEMELLQKTFKISSEILYYLPFLAASISGEIPTFENRQNFMAIGNLRHAPNVDAVLQLKKRWPEIKKQLPNTEIHIYGAYAPQQILQLNNKKEGFIIKGWTQDVADTMKNYRVQLAPLRFGAGLKGKLFDAMQYGLPSITTLVGAEGICGILPFGGSVVTTKEDFIGASVNLYLNETLWMRAQQNGFEILQKRFQDDFFSAAFNTYIHQLSANLTRHRHQNFLGQIVQHHTLQSTKYVSKWIEAKNTFAALKLQLGVQAVTKKETKK